MTSNNNYSFTYYDQPSYIYKNCHFVMTYLHAEALNLRFSYVGLAAVLFTIAPATIIFNLLTILTFIYKTKFRLPSNIFLCGVAITDFINGFTAIPLTGLMHLFRYLDNVTCPLFLSGMIIMYTLILMTFATMALISIDKYLAIFYPFKYNSRINKKTLIIKIIATVWTLVILCGTFTVFTPQLQLIRSALMATAGMLLPFTIFVYFRIFYELRRRRKQICLHCGSFNQETVINRIRTSNNGTQGLRATTTILVVLFFCYLPITVTGLLRRVNYLNVDSDRNNLIQAWLNGLVLLNSLMNPLIYCWQLKGFRKDLLNLTRSTRTEPSSSEEPES